MAIQTFVFVFTIVLILSFCYGKSEQVKIPVCPASHDRAFARGKKCCKYSEEKTAKNVLPRESDSCDSCDSCPSNDFVQCPSGANCEDSPPSCLASFELEGFGQKFDGYYSSDDNKSRQILFQEVQPIL